MSLAELDAGAIRTGNEFTAANQAAQFSLFCSSLGHNDLSFSHTKPADIESLLATFAMNVASGKFSVSRKPVALKSVKNHVRAAASFAIDACKKDPRYRYDQYGNKIGDMYFPALNLFYNQMEKWKKKSSKALPLNPAIITHLVTIASFTHHDSAAACISDAIILGCLTGAHCEEYCRGKAHKGDEFGKVPFNILTIKEFSGFMIALCSCDFVFLFFTHHVIPWQQAFPVHP
jgi:hypothetical protein